MSYKLYRLIKDFEPDLIISTHPFSSQMCARLRRHRKINCKIATILTDFHIHSQWLIDSDYIDYFFVSNTEMKKDLINYEIDEFKIFVTGIPLSDKFLNNYDKDTILKDFNLDSNKTNILFFAGGEFGLGRTRTFEIFTSLVENFPELQVIAISGKNEKMKKLFEDFVAENNYQKNVLILSYTDKVPELMSISDVVITKPGGLTSTESLASGLPIIIINPIPGQEEENARFLESNEVAVWIKKEDNIKDALTSVLNNPEKLKDMKQKTSFLAKKNSTKDICRILLEI
jgi:processive 1,2-diacylglycerol beta-glucosyltransferase